MSRPDQPIAASRLFAEQPLLGAGVQATVRGVARDSRAVAAGDAFVAMGGDDAAHARAALAGGAAMIVAEGAIPGVATLTTPHARWSHARASAVTHGLDRGHAPLAGVTGSAGKSTTTHCCWWALGGGDTGAARVGTIGWHDGAHERAAKQTTPPPEELHAFLADLARRCPGVAVEISSHAGDQERLAGLALSALAFTGLGHDHLDYHRTVAAYLDAKLRILRLLKPGAWVVINADDRRAATIAYAAQAAGAWPVLLGLGGGDAQVVRQGDGWRLLWDGVDHPLPVRLPGAFNAWNAAAGALLAHALGTPLPTALARLATLPAVPGRLELLARSPLTYVDYAHTPESIATMLRTLRGAFPGRRLVCVFGCGGDRDRSKRAPMGRAALLADLAVLTTDNSRSESPAAIADDVVAGLADVAVHRSLAGLDTGSSGLAIELDRGPAIVAARRLAGRDGVVVIAGKGHETTQEIQGRVEPWDDRAFVAGLDQGDRT